MISIETGCFQTSLLSAPLDGSVVVSKLTRGAMLSRQSPLFEKLNETAEITIEDKDGNTVSIMHRLLPGFAPLVIDAAEGDTRQRAQRYGVMLRGLTRVYLPASSHVAVNIGERVFGAQTPLGYLVRS